MNNNYLTTITCALLSTFFFIGCQTKAKETEIVLKNNFNQIKKQKKKKGVHKKGIEQIADYQKQIRKGIEEENSTYKKGYLVEEFNKAKSKKFKKSGKSAISPVFKERGPNNVPGRARGIAIDPNDTKRWFVGSVGGGVWLTEDSGATWETLTDFKVPNLATSTVVISQINSNILYAGTGEPFGNLGAIGGSGVFKTINGGATWQHLTATASLGDVGRMIINPLDDNNVLIGTTSGIYRTIDGGATWTKTYNSTGRVQDLDASSSDFNIQFGSVNGVGLVKSIDGGITWSVALDKAAVNVNHSRFETAVSEVNTSVVIVCAYSGSDGTVSTNTDLYISRDAGATFTNLTAPIDASVDRLDLVNGQGWYDNIVLTHPFDENIFYVGGVELFKVTVNNDDTFTALEIAATGQNGNLTQINTDVHVDQHGLAAIKGVDNAFQLILANDGGIYSSNLALDPGVNEGDWSSAALGKNSTQFYGATKQNGEDNYLTGAQDNGCWISLGNDANKDKEYLEAFGGDGFEVIWHYDNPQDFIVSSQNNRIGRYVNFAFAGQESLEGEEIFYTKLANANNNPNAVFSVSGNGVWRSADFAATWNLVPITSKFITSSSSTSSALNVKVSTADPNIVWAGALMTESGSYVLHVSKDNGQTFTDAGVYNNPNDNHNLFISGLGTSYIEKNRAYALFSSQGRPKILKTEDLGATWSDITGFEASIDTGFPDVAVHSILEMPFNKDIIWAGTDIGLFQTEDGGTSWSMITDLPSVAVYDLKVVNDQVVIATYGRGVWSATIPELSTYTLPGYLKFPNATAQQKEIESLKTTVSYNVPSDDVSRVKIFIDGLEQTEIVQDFSTEVTYSYETIDVAEGYHQLGIQVFDDVNNLETPINNQEFLVIDYKDAGTSIEISEFQDTDVFTYKSNFVIDNLDGNVASVVLNNSEHPYNNNKTYSVTLKQPLTISEDNKVFTYEDFALVEPYTDDLTDLTQFYDFVLIEASTDLITWKTLDKYDARRFPEWLTEYNKGDNAIGNDALFKEQNITLTDKGFAIGETIVFKLSLVSDPGASSYGWAIKSINKNTATASVEDVLAGTQVFAIYPTVSKGDFTLQAKSTLGKTKMTVFSLTGKQVFAKEVDFTSNGKQAVSVSLNAGVYIVNIIDENNKKSSSKIIIE
ncbi:T9SS type A sorting domain-containing protein [Polaribacter sp. 11A2H]|uniref:T9SS type A sorting domain-containing protein n=1 Tax=Polaribacter sp. 11A2H TaxID=2687290 RepID=UPI0014091D8D|nr:T9SS type A sorting domain-containing protein [Polaribacter sp. 11A2H]